MRTSPRRDWTSICSCIAVLLALAATTTTARAADLYGSANVNISGGMAKSSGVTGNATFSRPNTGSDMDSSPAWGASFGIGFALDEAIRGETEFPGTDWRMSAPHWRVRFEFEGEGGRDYEFATDGPAVYHSEYSAWTVMSNLWLDVPLYQPIEWAFGRVPILEPLAVYMGFGLGLTINDVSTSDGVSSGEENGVGFAWQAGAGLGYDLTERVTLGVGYRYVDLGSVDMELYNPIPFGNLSLDLSAHELATTVRVSFYNLPFWDGRGAR